MSDPAAVTTCQNASFTYTPSPPRFRVVLPDLSLVLDGQVIEKRREKVRFAPFAAVLGETDGTKPTEPLRDSPNPNSRKVGTPVNGQRKTMSPVARKSLYEDQEEIEKKDKILDAKDPDLSTTLSLESSFVFGRTKKRSSSVSEPFAFLLGSNEKENCLQESALKSANHINNAAEAKPCPSSRKPPNRKASGCDDDWQENIQEARRIRQLVEAKRMTGIQLNRQLSTHLAHKSAQEAAARRQALVNETELEANFKASVYQDHKKTIAEEAEVNRRKSIAARERLRMNRREGEKKLQLIRIEEDKALYEEGYEASVAHRKFESELANHRRESLALRAQQASFSRDQVKILSQEEFQKEHKSYELKFEAAKDVDAYLQAEAEKRRQSLAGRNEYASQQRREELVRNTEKARKDHESFELDLEAYRDTVEYEHAMKLRNRNSLAMRGLEARRRRIKEEQLRALQLEKEHESYELTWAGERDADAHCRKLKRLQRTETALLDSERRRKARVMAEIRQLEREKEAESFVLKRAGEKDADEYLQKLAADRRKSLQLRGDHTLQGRKVEQLQRAATLRQQHEDEEIRAACEKDVEEYRKACNERDRLSLQFRQKEARRKRLEDKNEKEKQKEQEHLTFGLKSEDRKNVEVYLKECKQRRRMSLAGRAKEKKRHLRWKQQQTQRGIMEQRQRAHENLMDKHYEELARHEERLRLTQEAIRHAGCAINPSFYPMG